MLVASWPLQIRIDWTSLQGFQIRLGLAGCIQALGEAAAVRTPWIQKVQSTVRGVKDLLEVLPQAQLPISRVCTVLVCERLHVGACLCVHAYFVCICIFMIVCVCVCLCLCI